MTNDILVWLLLTSIFKNVDANTIDLATENFILTH